MADYETISEGSHCVRHDMFGQCIYTHNNFSKGNSRLYGMPEKEEKIRGGGESPPKPKPKPDTPLTNGNFDSTGNRDDAHNEGDWNESIIWR